MKRVFLWTLMGVSVTAATALMLSQSVLGQPEAMVVLPPPAEVQPASTANVELPTIPMVPALPVFPENLQFVQAKEPEIPGKRLPNSESRTPTPDARFAATATPVSLEVAPGKQQPAVALEWAGPSSIRINQPMPCQIVVSNTGTTPAQNVVVKHRLAAGVVCKASVPPAAGDTDELTWNLGTLAPQQTKRIELVLVTQNRGELNCRATVTFTAVAGHLVQVREPQLSIKTTSPSKVVSGENITILLAISNPGDGTAEGVRIKAILPEGVEHPRGKVLDVEVGTLAAKEVRNMQLVCQTKGGGPQECPITITGDGGLQASDAAHFEVMMPKLELALSGPKLRYLDRPAVYSLKVANPGNAAASKVEVQQTVPAGFKFHQANAGGQYHEATRTVTWNLGDIPAGQSKDIAVELIPIAVGDHQLAAHARAGRGLKSQAEARTSVEGLPSIAFEVSHVDDPLEVGAETAFQIRVANTGTKAETNVEVVCILPEQLEFRGAKASTALKCRQEGRELIFEPLAKLAPKSDVTYRIQVRGVAAGDVRFRTRVKSDSLKAPVMREESIRIYSDSDLVKPTAFTVPTPAAKDAGPASLRAPSPIQPVTVPEPIQEPRPEPIQIPMPTPTPTPTPVTIPNPASVPLPAIPMPPTLPVLPPPGELPGR